MSALSRHMAGDRAQQVPENMLPLPRSRLLGREAELAACRSLLAQPHVGLLTLTGAGGSGKTRLALELAVQSTPLFPDGVVFVDLASVSDPNLVAGAIARALDLRETSGRPVLDTLAHYLRRRQSLLLLDNFEQIIAAAPLVAGLLRRCPALKLLVTSRFALHVTGEHEFPVLPLALPEGMAATESPEELIERYPAVALFCDRMRAVRHDFALTRDGARAIIEICRRLDGLPLAIELAAARTKVLSLAALVARLEHRLDLLAGGARDLPDRQRTLRDTIAWSYDLLEPHEQRIFACLGVVVGGCSLAAVEDVANSVGHAAHDGVFDVLSSLVDKSLLTVTNDPDGEPRFGMLETLREFALEQLAARDEVAAGERHARYFLRLAEHAEPWLRASDDQVHWLTRIEQDLGNMRAALAWSLAEPSRVDIALRLARALVVFWWIGGRLAEGRDWAERALAVPGGEPWQRAGALLAAGWLAFRQGDIRNAGTFFQESVQLFRDDEDAWSIGWALCGLARCAEGEAVAFGEAALRRFRLVGDGWGTAFALYTLAYRARVRGDDRQAQALFDESLPHWRGSGDKRGTALSLSGLGSLAQQYGQAKEAAALFEESLALLRQLGDREGVAIALASLASLARDAHAAVRAARLYGATEALREAIGALPLEEAAGEVLRSLGAGAADEAELVAAWAEGRSMTLEQAIAFATAPPPVRARGPGGLSPREIEVLRLVVAGCSNQEIANRLVLSVKTVERHLSSVYTRLDVRGRADATAYALRHELI